MSTDLRWKSDPHKPFDLTAGQPYQFRNFQIPIYMNAGLDRYIKTGLRPGDFLVAILSNDFIEAVGRADGDNLENLPAYVGFMFNEMQSIAWGSPKKFKAWCKLGGLEGQQAAEDKVNHYDETRPLADGSIKNTLTGEVTQPEPPHISKQGDNR